MFVSTSSTAISAPTPERSGSVPSVAGNNISVLATAIQQAGAKAYVAMNISMQLNKTAFLAGTADFIVS